MISEREASAGRREAVLKISSVEGVEKLGDVALFCRAVLVPSDLSINQQKFKTAASKDGIWDQDFSFTYKDGNDEIIFEVCEQKWFGREHLVDSATSSISDLLYKKHVTLCNSSGRLFVKLLDNNNMPLPNTRRLSGKKRVKREMSNSGELDMATFFQKKIEVHKSMIETLGSVAPELLASSYDEEELKRELGKMEDSLNSLGNGNNSFKNMLESLQPLEYAKLDHEMNLWSALQGQQQEDIPSTPPVYSETPLMDSLPVDVQILNEKVKLLQNELEIERAQVAVLKKRNFDLETEIKEKEEEIQGLRDRDGVRDKRLWETLSRIDTFDDKIQGMESERNYLRECEKRLIAQEKALKEREDLIHKSLQEMQSHKEAMDRVLKAQASSTPAQLNLSDSLAVSGLIEEKLSFLTSRLSKLDQLDEVMHRLENMAARGAVVQTPGNSDKRSAADIKAEMEELQKVIMDENAPSKDREAANLKIDRLFAELASTDEYKLEVKRAAEEKHRINEPLNREALKSVLQKFAEIAGDENLLFRKRQYPALTLIGMDHQQILGKHQNDFNHFQVGDLSLEEIRAIRASMPNFRRDQKRQQDFVESLDLKIETLAKNPPQVVKPKKVFTNPPNTAAKTRACGIGSRGGSMANLAAELMSKRRTPSTAE